MPEITGRGHWKVWTNYSDNHAAFQQEKKKKKKWQQCPENDKFANYWKLSENFDTNSYYKKGNATANIIGKDFKCQFRVQFLTIR